MDNISILIPTSANLPKERQRNFDFTLDYYTSMFPNAEIFSTIDDMEEGMYCKSKAINNAAKLSTKDILLIVDADIYVKKISIIEGIKKLNKYYWAIPFDRLIKLDEKQTELFIEDKKQIDISSLKYYKTSLTIGGFQIVRRTLFDSVKGYDERFVGWGGEDNSFLFSIQCLYGKGIRVPNSYAIHLHHPRQDNIKQYKANKGDNRELRNKYAELANTKNQKQMRKLIESRGIIDYE